MSTGSATGQFLRGLGIGVLALSVLAGMLLQVVGMGVLAVPLLFLGMLLLIRGKQYLARARASERAVEADRPPVLYLRPFRADQRVRGMVLSSTFMSLSSLASEEEQLADAVRPIGPLVAIGRPGEALPLPGALRVYAGNDEWQAEVGRMLASAQLVILRPGASEGVRWEIEQVFRSVVPERLLLLMVGVKQPAYESFARLVQSAAGAELPSFAQVREGRAVRGVLRFDMQWRPTFSALRAPFWRRSSYKPMRPLLHYALRPAFDALGLGWAPWPVSKGRTAMIGIGVLAFVMFAVSFLITALQQ
jgi:hypothetical protein